jgi:glycosyltransferase involved in cell wall biosynthesis
VVASIDAERVILRCLAGIAAECDGESAEVIVVDASSDATPVLAARAFPHVPVLSFPEGTLTPNLWAEGAARARGEFVVFTTGHCTPRPGWLRAFRHGMRDGIVAVGGPLVLASRTSPLDWAVFYLRYSAFTERTIGRDGPTEREIAGDNAAYRRRVLERHASLLGNGFWEVDIHRAVRAEGEKIAVAGAATVEFGPSFPLRTIARHRFAHGRHSGRGRVLKGTRGCWASVLAAPLVPGVLALRAARRVVGAPRERWRFAASLPQFLLLAAAWAAGEVQGAWTAHPQARP